MLLFHQSCEDLNDKLILISRLRNYVTVITDVCWAKCGLSSATLTVSSQIIILSELQRNLITDQG